MRHLFSIATLFSFSFLAMGATSSELAEFEACKPILLEKATSAGIDEKLVKNVVDELTLQSRVIELDRKQPEFVQTFPSYYSKRVNEWRITKGREMRVKHGEFLQELTNKFGVPPHYILSFWGLETNFGNYKGKMPVLDSLATLACDPRRSAYFSQEFVVALELMQRESLTSEQMVGSWAGAMGHTQFMPSAYKHYAIDGDGDGKVDLWNSEKDALASAAYFLANLNWKPGVRWGREVKLPDSFDYAQTGKEFKQSVSQWSEMGVTKADGQSLGNADIEGYIVVPAGHSGPKFLVYENFRTIMRWNNSEFYGIAVGKLAEQIAGGYALVTPLPDLPTYSIQQIKTLQAFLNTQGFDVGKPDGILGPNTRKGIRLAQNKLNMVADGYPSEQLIDMAHAKTSEYMN